MNGAASAEDRRTTLIVGNPASHPRAGKCASLTPRLPLTHTLIVDRIMRHPTPNGSPRFATAGASCSAANSRDADAKRSRLSALTGLPKLWLADAVHPVILAARPRA